MSSLALAGASNTTPSTTGISAITNQSQYSAEYTQFLQMLTTELQNQDPTSPMDTNQFTGQLVSFSQLEQQLQTNQSLQTMISNQQAGALNSTLGYLGHTVMATGDAVELSGTAPSTINYTLPSAAASATMTVVDSAGATVGTYPVTTTAGLNTVSFDGTQGGGDALPAGDYTYSIAATDSSGNAITATTYTSGVVSGVDTSTGQAVLHLGDLLVNASAVVEVSG